METSRCARSSAARRASSALSLAMPKPSWRASVSATSTSGSTETMRPVVIGHEFPGEPAVDQDRNEGDGCDAFSRHRFLELVRKRGSADILEVDRKRTCFVPVPRRMAFDGLPVAVRQAPPSDEMHHVAVVEHKDGGALAGERRADGVQADVVNVWKRRGVLEPFGEPEQGRLLFAAARQRLFGCLAGADVMLNAHRVQEISRRIANARGRNLRPEV